MWRSVPVLLMALACAPDDPMPPTVAPVDPPSLEARRKAVHEDVKRLVHDLTEVGRYDCCIEHPCNQCAMRAGGCRCGEGLRNGEPVCEECALMWGQGQGAEAGIDPDSVRSYLEASRQEKAKAQGAPLCACPEHAETEQRAP